MNDENNNTQPPSPDNTGDSNPDNSPGNTTTNAMPEKPPVPFENPAKNFTDGFLETLKLVILDPTRFFRDFRMGPTLNRALIFGTIIGTISGLINYMMFLAMQKQIFQWLIKNFPELQDKEFSRLLHYSQQHGGSIMGLPITIIFCAVGTVLGIFIMAGLYHIGLMVAKGANQNFETTCIVVSYSYAISVFQIIPIVGGLIYLLYGAFVLITGLSQMHQTTQGKALFAIVAPFLFCCCCIGAFVIMMVGMFGIR